MARKNPKNPYPLSDAQRAIVRSVGGGLPGDVDVDGPFYERFEPANASAA
jgi:hypothetical protein